MVVGWKVTLTREIVIRLGPSGYPLKNHGGCGYVYPQNLGVTLGSDFTMVLGVPRS